MPTNINLLPPEYREKEKFNIVRLLIITFIILLFFASGYMYVILETRISTKEATAQSLESQLASIQKRIQEVKDLEKDKKALAERVDIIENLILGQSRLTYVLGDFSETVLPEVWLDNLSLNSNQTFAFSANTYNNYLIAKYMNALKDFPRFDAIDLQYIRKSNLKMPEEKEAIEIVNFQLNGIFIPKDSVPDGDIIDGSAGSGNIEIK